MQFDLGCVALNFIPDGIAPDRQTPAQRIAPLRVDKKTSDNDPRTPKAANEKPLIGYFLCSEVPPEPIINRVEQHLDLEDAKA
jgi:hypothetical protein